MDWGSAEGYQLHTEFLLSPWFSRDRVKGNRLEVCGGDVGELEIPSDKLLCGHWTDDLGRDILDDPRVSLRS